ncbi:MAG TPA: SMC-Scp complex subunit ScpB [Nitrospiria bacterium]|nr:SMC-Scp complex subunit ScpB [Nitrospiria bacterium]
MEEHELTAVLEAVLFVSGEPMSVEDLSEVLEGTDPDRIRRALDRLKQSYESAGRGLQIAEVAGGYQIATRAECAPWIRSLEKIKTAARLSHSGLETLAIVAYKQPVTRGEIEAIRGVDSAYVLKTLLERRIVKIAGRREGLGRPMLYGTTREFLQYFGLKDLTELPALKEFKEVAETLPEHEPIHEPAGDVTH